MLGRFRHAFPNCYATPLCSPSRFELMPGYYGFRTPFHNSTLHVKAENGTIPSMKSKNISPMTTRTNRSLFVTGAAVALAAIITLPSFGQDKDENKQKDRDKK